MIGIKVIGKDYNNFIKKLFNLNIFYSDMYIKNNILYFKTDYKSYLILKQNKGVYKITIYKRYNVFSFIHEIKTNKFLYISIFLCIIYFLFLNYLIFKIEFDTDDNLIKNEIKEELYKNNIKLLRIKPNREELNNIKLKLSNKFYDDIEWLEINIKGNNIIISYVTKKNKKIIKEQPNRSVVAKKNGIIRKIISSNGVIVKNKNEYVSKGEEIITGNIIKDDTIIKQIPAEGSVFAEVWYKSSITFPLLTKEKKYTHNSKYNIYVSFFKINKKLYNNYESNSNKIYILKNDIIPLNLYIKKEKQYYYKVKRYTKNQAKELALNYLDKEFNKKLEKKDYIINKKVLNFSYKESKIKVDVLYKVYEDITYYKVLDSKMLNEKIENN